MVPPDAHDEPISPCAPTRPREGPSKQCIRCLRGLPIGEFYIDRARADGLTRYCKDCSKEKARQRHAANRERRLEQSRQWRAENREHRREYKRTRRAIEAAWMRRKRAADPEFRRRQAEAFKVWVAANRAHWNEYVHRRKARKRGVTVGPVSYTDTLAWHGRFCWLCGLPIDAGLTFDHVIPLDRGGSHTADNIRPAHRSCNSRKHTRLVRLEQSELPLE